MYSVILNLSHRWTATEGNSQYLVETLLNGQSKHLENVQCTETIDIFPNNVITLENDAIT